MNALAQTTTAIAQWDPNSGTALPAYLADAIGELGTNIPDRNTVPSLSIEGKVWTVIKDGNKNKLQHDNADGDKVPVPVMRVVLLALNADRGRSYYEGTYNPAASAPPKCWSPDGKAPDASVKEKQSALCVSCPQSVKGSKVQDGKEMVACSSHRMLAVAPAFDIAADPLRLKLPVTSDYDKDIVEHGWYALRQYVDWLKSRGLTHTALVVTKMKFDTNTAYPKVLFALDRPLTPEEMVQMKAALANPKVAELLAEKWTAAGSAGTPIDNSDIRPYGLEGAYADGWQAHPDSAGYSYKGQECIDNVALAARYPEPEVVIPAIPAAQQVVENVAAAPVVETVHVPLVAATADGWAVHPENGAYWFKGTEVLAIADVEAKYPAKVEAPAAVTPAEPPTPPAPPPSNPKPTDPAHIAHTGTAHEVWWDGTAWIKPWIAAGAEGNAPSVGAPAPATGPTGSAQTAAGTTSPSSGEVPADVQNLLDKWATG